MNFSATCPGLLELLHIEARLLGCIDDDCFALGNQFSGIINLISDVNWDDNCPMLVGMDNVTIVDHHACNVHLAGIVGHMHMGMAWTNHASQKLKTVSDIRQIANTAVCDTSKSAEAFVDVRINFTPQGPKARNGVQILNDANGWLRAIGDVAVVTDTFGGRPFWRHGTTPFHRADCPCPCIAHYRRQFRARAKEVFNCKAFGAALRHHNFKGIADGGCVDGAKFGEHRRIYCFCAHDGQIMGEQANWGKPWIGRILRQGHILHAGQKGAAKKMADIDFGRTAADYAAHRQGFPAELYDRLERDFALGSGLRALDLGTGTGAVARNLAARGLEVDAIDPSDALRSEAQRLDLEANVEVRYRAGTAEDTGFEDGLFDFVFAGQCWHWFDRPAAAAEAHRVLKPGGRIVICHFDWIPLPGNVVDATERLILAHNPDWAGARGIGLYPRWFRDLSSVGFDALESFSFDNNAIYSHEAWRGRVRASAGIAASLEIEDVAKFDQALADMLRREFPDDPLLVHHRTFALVGVRM